MGVVGLVRVMGVVVLVLGKKLRVNKKLPKIFHTGGQGGHKLKMSPGGGEEGNEVKPDQPRLVKR